jgi:hypothetical protein
MIAVMAIAGSLGNVLLGKGMKHMGDYEAVHISAALSERE